MCWDRYFTEMDAERIDDLGFLDPVQSPRLFRCERLLSCPVGWILGPPWIGKSTAAAGLRNRLRTEPSTLPGVEDRVTLTRLDSPDADRTIPPPWWAVWVSGSQPAAAVWLVD